MADIPLWVPVITAVAPIIAVTIPLVINAIGDDRRDRRDREDRLAQERQRYTWKLRKECAKLLRTARDFRVLVENDYEYNGPEKAERGWEIRRRASEITGQSDEIGMLVPGLVDATDALGDAAAFLVAALVDDKGRPLGGSTKRPDFTEYERCVKEFKTAAMEALNQGPTLSDGFHGNVLHAERNLLETASSVRPA